ncbi:aldo/keto reductase [Candidatus Francisella endociliophora]|uniref:Aldo/keto reductase n=1 Tax=Candidatus Francisella endociliophora TaxID=653937 RepID=A0A097EME4_9GAMM|nr:aldo/keto reductase [Francisella sp. FSC1006]AIT08735.1 aldo/keto reductase [Francisella sp. FSC1006]
MQYTKLGKTNIDISRICLGTMTWGRQNTQAEGFEQMNYALSKGVNFWDTAEMYAIPPTAKTYGKTEEIIGNWFKASKKRQDVILATKFSPMPWARNEENPVTNKATIIDAVNNSLKRLQTDYIDLYQFHWPTNRPHYHFGNWWDFEPSVGHNNKEQIVENIYETLITCDELVKAGKIKYIGLSNDSAWGINQFIKLSEKYNLPRLASIQHEYNLNRRRDETDVMETCALEDISYLAWSPLEQGVITGKYRNGARPAGTRMSPEILDGQEDRYGFRFATNDNAVTEYIEVAKKHNLDICQMAIAFTIRKPYMSCSIIGATTMDQLKTNIDAINLKLSDEVLADIEKVRRKYPVPF